MSKSNKVSLKVDHKYHLIRDFVKEDQTNRKFWKAMSYLYPDSALVIYASKDGVTEHISEVVVYDNERFFSLNIDNDGDLYESALRNWELHETSDELADDLESVEVSMSLEDVSNLVRYEFNRGYDTDKAKSLGAFVWWMEGTHSIEFKEEDVKDV